MVKLFIVGLFLFFCASSFAQGSNPNYYQPREIVNMPNAGLLADRAWMGQIRIGESGGLVASFSLGLWGRLQAGVSYGADGVLGRGKATPNERPAFSLKARPFLETMTSPAIVLGYSDQGVGKWYKESNRFAIKSPGFYIAASKNWITFGGNFGLHGGVNYSLENEDQDMIDVYIGFDKNLGEIFAFSLEYDSAINDNDTKDGRYGSGKGYLNAAIKWSVRPDFEIEFLAQDLLINMEGAETFSREVRLTFIYPL